MWQDGVALFIVVIAALALLRSYLAPGLFRFGVRWGGDGSAQNAPPAGGCGGCASGSSCAKMLIQARPSVIQQGEQLQAKHL